MEHVAFTYVPKHSRALLLLLFLLLLLLLIRRLLPGKAP
jgi:hypothetical protein